MRVHSSKRPILLLGCHKNADWSIWSHSVRCCHPPISLLRPVLIKLSPDQLLLQLAGGCINSAVRALLIHSSVAGVSSAEGELLRRTVAGRRHTDGLPCLELEGEEPKSPPGGAQARSVSCFLIGRMFT